MSDDKINLVIKLRPLEPHPEEGRLVWHVDLTCAHESNSIVNKYGVVTTEFPAKSSFTKEDARHQRERRKRLQEDAPEDVLNEVSRRLAGKLPRTDESLNDHLEQLGKWLFDGIFSPGVLRDAWKVVVGHAGSRLDCLRIVIAAHHDLGWLPFEALYVEPYGFLAMERVSLVRVPLSEHPMVTLAEVPLPMELRFIAPSPLGTTALGENEYQTLLKLTRGASAKVVFKDRRGPGTGLHWGSDVAPPAQVFHFAGHGAASRMPDSSFGDQGSSSWLCFTDFQGRELERDARELQTTVMGTDLACAFLNACWSARTFATHRWEVDEPRALALLGLQFEAGHFFAVACAESIYGRLFKGVSLEDAITEFRKERQNEGDWIHLVLFVPAGRIPVWPHPGGGSGRAELEEFATQLIELDGILTGRGPLTPGQRDRVIELGDTLTREAASRGEEIRGYVERRMVEALSQRAACEMARTEIDGGMLQFLWDKWTEVYNRPTDRDRERAALGQAFTNAWQKHMAYTDREHARAAANLAAAMAQFDEHLGDCLSRQVLALIRELLIHLGLAAMERQHRKALVTEISGRCCEAARECLDQVQTPMWRRHMRRDLADDKELPTLVLALAAMLGSANMFPFLDPTKAADPCAALASLAEEADDPEVRALAFLILALRAMGAFDLLDLQKSGVGSTDVVQETNAESEPDFTSHADIVWTMDTGDHHASTLKFTDFSGSEEWSWPIPKEQMIAYLRESGGHTAGFWSFRDLPPNADAYLGSLIMRWLNRHEHQEFISKYSQLLRSLITHVFASPLVQATDVVTARSRKTKRPARATKEPKKTNRKSRRPPLP